MKALRIALLPLLLVSTASAESPAASAARVLQPFVERREIAGAVTLVADRQTVLEVTVVGAMDIAAGKAMREDALFWIASMSKPITATAVMMLVDEGRIQLDDPVEKYLPEFKGQQLAALQDGKQTGLKPPSHPITVREILSHTSGLPFKTPEEAPTLDLMPLEQAVQTYAHHPLQFDPGTAYAYSNAGINTSARILEVVSGIRYEDFLEQRLFGPLGMKDTTFWPSEAQVARLAKGYKPNAAKDGLEETPISQLLYPLSDRTRRFPMPAGGLFSTAADCARFCRMILNGGELEGRRYLSEKLVREMTSRQTPLRVKNSYGLGWAVNPDDFGHSGAMATNMTIHPKDGLITIYLVQHSGFHGNGKNAGASFRQAALRALAKPRSTSR
jgi:CubicO group peptidase (beta-lactamase class C family)